MPARCHSGLPPLVLSVSIALALFHTAVPCVNAQTGAAGPAAQAYQSNYSPLSPAANAPASLSGSAFGSARPGRTQIGPMLHPNPWSTMSPSAEAFGPVGAVVAENASRDLPAGTDAIAPTAVAGGTAMGVGSTALAPVNVRGYLGQPGIASAGLGPLQTTGAGSAAVVLSLPGGAQLASTGYGASAEGLGLSPYVGAAPYISSPQPSVINPAWTLSPVSGSQLAYGSLGPPFNYISAQSAAPLAGTGRPALSGLGVYGPAGATITAQEYIEPQTAAPVREYQPPQRSYWFRLGKGGLGRQPEPP